jgi:glutamine cyclotransferase
MPRSPDRGLGRGTLVEGTGHYGESELRRVTPATGAVLRSVALAANEFGEGVAVVGDRVLQLTWQNHRAYARDLTTFAPLDTFDYAGEGWGLAWAAPGHERRLIGAGLPRPGTFAELGPSPRRR